MTGLPHHSPSRPVPQWPTWVWAVILVAAGGWIFWVAPPVNKAIDAIVYLASDFGWLLIAMGLLTMGHVATHGRFTLATPGQRLSWSRAGLAVVIILAAGLFANRVGATKTAMLDGVRTFWLDDDMMISMRFARNLAEGAGLVWNPGQEPVEGYTNLLWTLVMAMAHCLGWTAAKTPAVILALNGLGFLLLVGLTEWVGWGLGLAPAWRWLAALLVAGNRWVLYWAVGGSEAILLGVLVMIAAGRALNARRGRPLGWGDGLTLGLMGLVRADAAILVAALLGLWLLLARRDRTRPWAWTAAVVPLVGQFLWRRLYYGDWFPNTYYLKVVDVPTREIYGVMYGLTFADLFGGALLLVVLAMVLTRRPVARWLGGLTLIAVAYCVYIGGDELAEFRFVVPLAPLMILMAMVGLKRALASARGLSASFRFAVAILMLSLFNIHSLCLPHELLRLGTVRGRMERDNVRIGLMLKAHTRPEAVVAHFWAGAAPYFSERPALDMLGKCDRRIAHLSASPRDFQPGHNKHDGEWSFAHRPDVVVAALSARTVGDPHLMATSEARKNYPGLFLPLENSIFRREYSSQVLRTPLSKEYHGIFIRGDSSQVDLPQSWTEVSLGRQAGVKGAKSEP